MTPEKAIEILNGASHYGYNTWTTHGEFNVRANPSSGSVRYLSNFEAVAIAEKYERDAGKVESKTAVAPPATPEPMTVERACDILGAAGHKGYTDWEISTYSKHTVVNRQSNGQIYPYSFFEAIAIAKHYEATMATKVVPGSVRVSKNISPSWAAAILNIAQHEGRDNWEVVDGPTRIKSEAGEHKDSSFTLTPQEAQLAARRHIFPPIGAITKMPRIPAVKPTPPTGAVTLAEVLEFRDRLALYAMDFEIDDKDAKRHPRYMSPCGIVETRMAARHVAEEASQNIRNLAILMHKYDEMIERGK